MVDSHLSSSPEPTPPSPTTFADLGLPRPLVRALADNGIVHPFPIQAATLPDALAGRDVLGRGATGSGKSYAFLLPIVARLSRSEGRARPGKPRALVLAPTRELATQLAEGLAPLAAATGLSHTTVFGGVPVGPQNKAFQRGVDVVVACPGRLNDHLASGRVDLSDVEISVLDEADHMSDLGFLPDVRRILDRTPRDSQRLLFSATLDNAVDVVVKRYLTDPVEHHVEPAVAKHDIPHRILRVDRESRVPTIAELAATPGRVVVFTRTKHGAKRLARQLSARGVPAVDLHGDLSQNARQRNLTAFSDGSVGTLVATDIAARGIHVDDVALVVHADPPADHKAYVHRSGRTARAGAAGEVVTLALAEQYDDVQKMARKAKVVFDDAGATARSSSAQPARSGREGAVPSRTAQPSGSQRRRRRGGAQRPLAGQAQSASGSPQKQTQKQGQQQGPTGRARTRRSGGPAASRSPR